MKTYKVSLAWYAKPVNAWRAHVTVTDQAGLETWTYCDAATASGALAALAARMKLKKLG
jgi:hypothetical protein